MSMRDFESKITAQARIVLNNKSLRTKDIMEWRLGEIKEIHEGEINVELPNDSEVRGVWISVKKECDKRTPPLSSPTKKSD